MTDDTQFAALLRSAIPPVGMPEPPRDLWPRIADLAEQRVTWSWIDIGLAAGVAISFAAWPDVLMLLVYHL